jgi:hypothetical protein
VAGPFAAAGSVLVLAGTFLLAIGIVLLWPLKAVLRAGDAGRHGPQKFKRVVVIGLDGFDPGLAQKYMAEGRMPNLKALSERAASSRSPPPARRSRRWRGRPSRRASTPRATTSTTS